jgi:hypothetical protein
MRVLIVYEVGDALKIFLCATVFLIPRLVSGN